MAATSTTGLIGSALAQPNDPNQTLPDMVPAATATNAIQPLGGQQVTIPESNVGSTLSAMPSSAPAASTGSTSSTGSTAAPSSPAALTPTANISPTSPATVPPPATYTINPATDTTSGQFNALIQQDSPLITNARTQAAQQANARGLLNSSMAVGAGELAADQAALPIAQANANAYLGTGMQNTSFLNQSALQQLSGNQQYSLGQLEWNNKSLLQANQSAGQLFSTSATSISDILKNENIPVDQKQQLIDKQIELLQNGLSVIGGISNLDLNSLLNFSTTDLAATPAPEPTPTVAPSD